MGRKRGERRGGNAATRQSLVDAAAALFHDQGYGSTTVPDIVKAAGVGHGTFYEYFGSKRDVLVAITQQAVAVNANTPVFEGKPVAEQVRLAVYWYLMNCVENLSLSRIWFVASTLDPEVAEMVGNQRREQLALVKQTLEAANLPLPDLDVAVAAVAAMLDGFAYRWYVLGEGPGTSATDVITACETLTAMVLGALGIESLAPLSVSS